MSPQPNRSNRSSGSAGGGRRSGSGGTSRSSAPGAPRRTWPGAKRVAGQRRAQQPQRPRSSEPYVDVHNPEGTRLQKLLAGAGVGSRRTCERLIAEGHVQVDGHVVTDMGVRVDPETQQVHVDGERVIFDESKVYLAFNKPLNVVTSMHDELGRVDIGDYLGEGRKQRLFHVGRLDQDTEGLLLLTNDGELAHRLQHPAYGVTKTYLAQVPGPLPRDLGQQLREGVELEDGPAKVDQFSLLDVHDGRSLVKVVLHEGRKHIVRRLLAEVGHPVESLVRTRFGSIALGDQRAGTFRKLNRKEVSDLYEAVGL